MARLTIAQYMRMLESGYSAEELDEYNRSFSSPENTNIPQHSAERSPAETAENTNIPQHSAERSPAETAENTNIPPTAEAESAALAREMRELLALMRNNNIRNSIMPTESPTDPAQIMASILAPAKSK